LSKIYFISQAMSSKNAQISIKRFYIIKKNTISN